jgi:hypothetical protein
MEHIKECTVEYQRIGEEKRKEKWPCDQADGFQRLVGRDKIKISSDFIARVRFPLEDGRTHEVNVDDVQLGTYGLAIGATLPVIYAPDNPADVRGEMSWERLKIPLSLFAIGIACLALSLGGPLAALFGWAFRGRTSRAGEETVSAPSEHLAPTLTRASELGDSSRSQRRPNNPANVNTYSPTTGPTPRPSFGMRNR